MSKDKLLKSTSKKKKVDPETEAALEVVDMEKKQLELMDSEQERKEFLLAKTNRMMGRIETADLFGKLATVSSLMWIKQVKEAKWYKDIPEIGTWENFCNHLGKSRRLVDEQLANLDVFGEEFLETCFQFSVGYRDLKKLRHAVKGGEITIDDNAVQIGGETIPFSPDNKEDLQAAIETVIEAKDRKLEETESDLKAKDRVLKEKEKVIRKQEKELSKYEKEVKERGYKPGEENFIKEMGNLRTLLTGLELKMDPDNMPEDATQLMISEYMETLGHFRRTITAYYDTATEQYGDFTDDDWDIPTSETQTED